MARHNNMIPNGHFHKSFVKNISTWFKQPMKKKARQLRRIKKQRLCAPKPSKKLRSAVHCPTARYNCRTRRGRGFTLNELKAAGLNPKFARTIGIAVDQRRKNQCLESLVENRLRIQEYLNKLVMKHNKEVVDTNLKSQLLNKIRKQTMRSGARVPTEEEKDFKAFGTLRKAMIDEKLLGRRLKKKQGLADADCIIKPSKRHRCSDED